MGKSIAGGRAINLARRMRGRGASEGRGGRGGGGRREYPPSRTPRRVCQFKEDEGELYPFYYVHPHRVERHRVDICDDCRNLIILQRQAAFVRWCDGREGDAAAGPPEQEVREPASPTARALAELEARNMELAGRDLLPEDDPSLREQIAAMICPADEMDYDRKIERYRTMVGKGAGRRRTAEI